MRQKKNQLGQNLLINRYDGNLLTLSKLLYFLSFFLFGGNQHIILTNGKVRSDQDLSFFYLFDERLLFIQGRRPLE